MKDRFFSGALAAVAVGLLLPALPAFAQTAFEARTPDGNEASMPLMDERLTVRIDGQYARTTVHQSYKNMSKSRAEGRYLLKSGDGSRVLGFAYWNGEKKIRGEVFEKETARRVYEEVTGLGRDPGLLEQVGEGAFSFRVFPIEPNEVKPIQVQLGKWLPRSAGVVEYRMPLALPGASIRVKINDERGIEGLTSPSHELSVVARSKSTTELRITAPKTGAKDFVLRYRPKVAPWSLSSYVHKDKGHDGYLAVTIATPDNVPESKIAAKDVTLVLDRSGSMNGAPLNHAKLAAKAVVSRLEAGDRINVVLFDDGVESLFPKPRSATMETKTEALAYIDKVASAGGTDIAGALRHAFKAQLDDELPNVVLFLTDGQSDARKAIASARTDTNDARLFTIGVGSGVEKPLLSRLAKEKRGRFTYIESPTAIGQRMATLYRSIENPVMVDVQVAIDGVRLLRRYPRSMPDLYQGDELRITGRVRDTGTAKITVRGLVAGKPVEHTTTTKVVAQKRPWVGRVWAESRVDDLLEEIALLGENEELKNEVINLAVAYNFVTPYTSFLAIPESELTDTSRTTLANARDRKKQILAAHKDAVALSRKAMPPGDPILKVRAPKDALQVTAYFPFGLEKDMVFDSMTEHWSTRFLVPKSVVDGTYEVKIVILHANGKIELAKTSYTIDSKSPELEVETKVEGATVEILVKAGERLRGATVVTDDGHRVDLTLDPTELVLRGKLELSSGKRQLTLVVSDRARNETEKKLEVEIQ